MYNSQEIVKRIKFQAKEKKITISQLLLECGLGKNTIVKMNNGTDILSQNLAKIADYLEISVDYLLGRTDDPYTSERHSIQTGNVGDNNGNGDTSVKIYNAVQLDETTQQLVKAFQSLDLIGKSKVMGLVGELNGK